MKKFIFIAASSLFNIAAAQAADGTITINGLVTDNTCTIDTGDKNLTVNLPTVGFVAQRFHNYMILKILIIF